ncbi:hydrogen peroxide-inducible genes activator [Geofilum rubicundum]|uniref:Hydrogen peroxide-inducible genes activator n=1 Tax=Geofilum rubicundum JCM 15548 TaxID=1236989 RepID=A0A0E9LZY0_9BACT|nr:hydrogen peroxide-inducible genes activator [Geofilum rubicundum]GAO31127.1 hydrogen peroxide-inducible genes activator [Geofilum rubicundum JCM 15548]
MNIQQLEYVIALDDFRHFVSAAENCHVTQPTLTMQLKKLEEELDVLLFDRSKKPLKPTPEGVLFIAKARRILKDINDLHGALNGEKNSLKGQFRLGIIPTIAPHLLPLFLPLFAEKFADTRLVIEEMESELIIKALHENRLDLAIMATPAGERDLQETVLFNESFVFYGPAEHPLLDKGLLSPDGLDANHLLLLSEGHCFRSQALNICKTKVSHPVFNFQYESGSIETIKGLVKKGIGYTLIPELAISEGDKAHVRRFEQPEPVREVSIVCHKSFNRPVLIDSIKTAVRNSLPAHITRPREFVKIKWR